MGVLCGFGRVLEGLAFKGVGFGSWSWSKVV